MKNCEHKHFDMQQTGGPGYVRCSDCGKSIPLERALGAIDRRIRNLERLVLELTKEDHDDGR